MDNDNIEIFFPPSPLDIALSVLFFGVIVAAVLGVLAAAFYLGVRYSRKKELARSAIAPVG